MPVYFFEAYTEEGVVNLAFTNLRDAKASHKSYVENECCQTFDIDSEPTPNTKADWVDFINRRFGGPH